MNPFLVYILKVSLLTAVFVLLYHLLLRRDTFHRTLCCCTTCCCGVTRSTVLHA